MTQLMNLKNWKISYKILLVVGLLSCVTLVVGMVGYLNIGKLDRATDTIQVAASEALQGARINKLVVTMNRAEYRLVAEPTADRLKDVEQATEAYRREFKTRMASLTKTADADQKRRLNACAGRGQAAGAHLDRCDA